MATKKAVATRDNTAMMSPADIIQQQLEQNQNLQAGNSNVIGLRDKMFELPDGSSTPGPIDLVILDYAFQNRFYETRWDPQNPSPPDCFAVSVNKDEKGMIPVDESPNKQCDSCADCPMNVFGSAGDGKACKNTMLFAVMDPTDPDGELMLIRASATALKGAKGHVKHLAAIHGQVPVQRVTTFSFHPDKTWSQVVLEDAGENPNWEAFLSAKAQEAAMALSEPPDFTMGGETSVKAKPPARKAAPRKKTAARRRVA